jgi:hypothetical protein
MPWIKQDALRKSEVEDSSSSKYIPPHRRHIKVMTILFVRMLTIFLQRKSKSIPTKEVYPPVITATPLVTFDPNVDSSRPRSRRFRGSCQQKLHQALYL